MSTECEHDEALQLIEPQADMEAEYLAYAHEWDDPADINNHAIDAIRYHFEEQWTGAVIDDISWALV